MEEVYGVIYLITNLINGKKYVGQTICSLIRRWQGHKSAANKNRGNMAICHAINKYGKENFAVEEIAQASSQKKLNKKEEFYIKQYDSTNKEKGYNIRSSCKGAGSLAEETKKIISDKAKIYCATDEGKKNLSKAGKTHRGVKKSKSSSIYIGVTRQNPSTKNRRKTVRFTAALSFECHRINFGTYILETDAAKAYDIGAIKHFGLDANLNFPELREQYIKGFVNVEKTNRKLLGDDYPKGISYIRKTRRYRVRLVGIQSKVFKELAEAVNYLKNPEKPVKYIPRSKYIGVRYRGHQNNIVSRIGHNNQRYELGSFGSEIDAAKAYDIKAIELRGVTATLNFPELLEDYVKGTIKPVRTGYKKENF